MKVKELREILEQYGDNTSIYVRYHGLDIEIEHGDTFKIKEVEEEYKGLILNI